MVIQLGDPCKLKSSSFSQNMCLPMTTDAGKWSNHKRSSRMESMTEPHLATISITAIHLGKMYMAILQLHAGAIFQDPRTISDSILGIKYTALAQSRILLFNTDLNIYASKYSIITFFHQILQWLYHWNDTNNQFQLSVR